MNTFKAVLFAGMVLASQATAQTFVRFHSGVNLSVAPGGSDRSAAPLDVQEAANAQRVAEAADIGFDFIRLRVSLAPWTDTGSIAEQQKALTLANGIVQQALAHGMRVDVVMMAGSLSTTTAAGLICSANPSAVAAWTAGWQAVLALLPDTFHLAFEPLNEPPNCAEGNRAWDAAQLSVYHQVRALRRAVKFVVYGTTGATTSERISPPLTRPRISATPMSYSRSTTTTRSRSPGKGSHGYSMVVTAIWLG
jgi:hypothetical protein